MSQDLAAVLERYRDDLARMIVRNSDVPGTMGLLQATEVVKLILGIGDPAIGRLLLYDALGATLTEVKVHRDPDCPICSLEPDEITDEEMGVFPDYEAFCAAAG